MSRPSEFTLKVLDI